MTRITRKNGLDLDERLMRERSVWPEVLVAAVLAALILWRVWP